MLTQEEKGWLVQACINCYDGHHGDVDWSMHKDVERFKVENCDGYFSTFKHPQMGNCLLIVHEGSSSDKDNGADWWKTDFRIELVKGMDKELIIPYGNDKSPIRMHKGFVEYYKKIRDIIRTKAVGAHNNNMPIFITGHSLGGAATTVNYADLNYMFNDEMKAQQVLIGYAAASPRVFNKAGADSSNKRANGNFYNEFYGNDTVHTVPPTVGMGYWHVEQEKNYSDAWAIFQTPFVRVLQGVSLGFLPSLAVWDHDPRKLFAAVLGKPVPMAELDSKK